MSFNSGDGSGGYACVGVPNHVAGKRSAGSGIAPILRWCGPGHASCWRAGPGE